MTGVLHTARINAIEVIVSSDKLITMVNFKLGNEMWRWINRYDTSVGQRKNLSSRQESNPWPPVALILAVCRTPVLYCHWWTLHMCCRRAKVERKQVHITSPCVCYKPGIRVYISQQFLRLHCLCTHYVCLHQVSHLSVSRAQGPDALGLSTSTRTSNTHLTKQKWFAWI